MYEAPVGLARVTDRASYYPYNFKSFRHFNLPGVSEVPIRTFVLVLGQHANDQDWAPVVVNEIQGGRMYARFTWMPMKQETAPEQTPERKVYTTQQLKTNPRP